MRISTVLLCVALGCVDVAVAQPGAGAGTSANSGTAVSADRSGASASNNSAAAANTNAGQAHAAAAGDSEFSAALSKPIDASRAKQGDEVTATSTQDLRSNGQVLAPRGSRLIGHVTQAQPKGAAKGTQGGGNATSSLGLVFDHAVLKDGRQVPLHATILALAAAQSTASDSLGGAGSEFSGVGSAAGTAGSGGGGLLGDTVGSVGAVGGAAGSVAGGVGGTIGVAGSAAGSVGGWLSPSAGAIGGVNSAGRFASGSQGVFGLQGFDLTNSAAGNAEGSVITSTSRNVRLDSGTRMLLSASGGAGQ